ncbi:MAG: PadR family transcriptional regulator [Coriobacteriia bacterium]|nr:PadR family transcriptional regulator [Coriobacteriia bacterium]
MPTITNASAKELFVLGRLSSRPTHGHEIMRTLAASRSDLWVELSEKHVYYVLNKLERDGFVAVEVQREGARPARKVFSITPAGRAEFARLMTAESLVESMAYSEFDVVFGMLAYTEALSPAEKTAVLQRRADYLRRLIAETAEARAAAQAAGAAGLPARIFDKLERVTQAELDWLGEVLDDVARDGWVNDRPAAGDHEGVTR